VTTKKATVEAHEKTCFRNPDRKACSTCAWHERDTCEDLENPGFFKNYSICHKPDFTPPEMYKKHGVAWDCPGWEEFGELPAWMEIYDECSDEPESTPNNVIPIF